MAIDMPMIQGGIAAYRAGSTIAPAPTETAAADRSPGASFADMVSGAARSATDTVRTADRTGQAGILGEANLQQVVEATMAMESTVKVSVAIRDSVVQSYQEILRMPV